MDDAMIFVFTAVGIQLVLMALSQWQLLTCSDLIDRKHIPAPKPTPFFWTRNSAAFFDFVLMGRYGSPADVDFKRSCGRLRVLILTQLSLFIAVFGYVLTL